MQSLTKIATISMLSKDKNIYNKNTKIKKNSILFSVFIVFLIVLMVIFPNLCISSVYSGLAVWAKCVVPSLFPFMFFTKLLTNLNVIHKLTNKTSKLTSWLFKAPQISSYIFLMSIISGYPVGAKLVSEYQKMGILTPKQATKICTFASTSGPLFIIGSVGTAMMGSPKLGYILFASHIVGAILNGIIYRKFFVENIEKLPEISKNNENILQNSMKDSILSVLTVGGFIAIAFLVIEIFNHLGLLLPFDFLFQKILNIFGVDVGANALSSGLLEVSKGALMLSSLPLSPKIMTTIASFLIGFGGICVLMQSIAFLKDAKVNLKFYTLQKFTHGILSALVCFLICTIFRI